MELPAFNVTFETTRPQRIVDLKPDRPPRLQREAAAQEPHRETNEFPAAGTADVAIAARSGAGHGRPIGIGEAVAIDGEGRASFQAVVAHPTGEVRRQNLAQILVGIDACGVLETNLSAGWGTAIHVTGDSRARVINVTGQVGYPRETAAEQSLIGSFSELTEEPGPMGSLLVTGGTPARFPAR